MLLNKGITLVCWSAALAVPPGPIKQVQVSGGTFIPVEAIQKRASGVLCVLTEGQQAVPVSYNLSCHLSSPHTSFLVRKKEQSQVWLPSFS